MAESIVPIAQSERLLAVVGPSGAGKDSVLAAWRALQQQQQATPHAPAALPHYARRVITRAADPRRCSRTETWPF